MLALIQTLEDQLLIVQDESKRLDILLQLTDSLIYNDNHRALDLAHQALDLAHTLADENRLTQAFMRVGRVNASLSNHETAETNLLTALARFTQAGDESGQAQSSIALAYIHLNRSQHSQALEYFLAALALAQKLASLLEELRCLRGLGCMYKQIGDYVASLDYYLRALHLCETHPESETSPPALVLEHARLLNNMADQMLLFERWPESLDYSAQALSISRRIGNKDVEIVALANTGEAYLRLGQPTPARPLLEQALALSQEIGERRIEIRILTSLGQAQAAAGNSALARQRFGQAIELSRLIINPLEELISHTSFAEQLLESRETTEALEVLQQVLALSERLAMQAETCRAHELLVTAYKQQELYREALGHHQQFHELKQQLHGDKQDQRIESLLVQHEVEKTRQIAAAQHTLNQELQRTNDELAAASRHNQQLLEQVRFQAQHDSLTGLPNRNLFEDRLQQAVLRAARYKESFAVMFLDLDGFKLVNDTLGHDAGDQLLIQVARRFESHLRQSDTIARLGGDEFTVIAHHLASGEDSGAVARKLLNSLEAPFEIRGQRVLIGASIGVSLYPQDGEDIVTLQKHADVAMYHVKHGGKRDICFYSPGMNAGEIERVLIESELCSAVTRGELRLHYQPQFAAGSGELLGFEALLRWTNAKLGGVAPDKFIAIAEESGLIVSIGEWVLREACRQLAEWRGAGHRIYLAVNVSPVQFERAEFTQLVIETLKEYDLPATSLELELTERAMFADQEQVVEKLIELRGHGVRIAIDDFGTGHSSLTYLLELPIDILKVDKTFVGELEASAERRKVVEAIITLSRAMNLLVVAEGVETKGQLEILQKLGVERTQGYLQGHPLPSGQARALLELGSRAWGARVSE